MKTILNKKFFVFSIIAIFICTNIFTSTAIIVVEKPSYSSFRGDTLYVGGSGPGNFSRIQDAINNAVDGDTVFVYNGTYYENVEVDKSIRIIGEDKNTTFVNRHSDIWDSVFKLLVGDIELGNFTIQKGEAGIAIWTYEEYCENILISDCNIENNTGYFGGLYIQGPGVSNIHIKRCYFGNNDGKAIDIGPWSKVPLTNIMFSYCCFDIDKLYVMHSKNLTFTNCEFFKTEINVKEICLDTNLYNCNMDSSPEIALSIDGSNVNIENCTFTNGSWEGLRLDDSFLIENVMIRNCVFRNNFGGISMFTAENVVISDCIIEDNERFGIHHRGLYDSIVENCHIANNKYGLIHASRIKYQKFTRNNFIDNEIHVLLDPWGYLPLIHYNYYENNYWDDWEGSGPYRVLKQFSLWSLFNWDKNPASEPYDI